MSQLFHTILKTQVPILLHLKILQHPKNYSKNFYVTSSRYTIKFLDT